MVDQHHLILWLISYYKNNLIMLPWNKELISPAFPINVGSQFQEDAFVGFMSSYRFLWTTKAKSWMRNNDTVTRTS